STTGSGSWGYARPAAPGAELGGPDRPVVCVMGDGARQFPIGELATAVELALPMAILLWNNRGYGEIKKYMVERGIPRIGVDIYTPDFQTIALGFGCRAARAESLADVQDKLRQSQQHAGPTLIEIDEESTLQW